MSKSSRPRRDRRKQERELRKGVRATERLALKLPGATPEAAIEVPTPSIAEIQARATRCPQCGGELDLRAERAATTPRGVLRELHLVCRLCHAPRTLWFLVAPPLAN